MTQHEHVDVLIVGAGLSGIGAACHLQRRCPDRSYAIVEARDVSGGTWELFRYPGVRSDSDMYTLGYAFRPWKGTKAIADGPSILQYLRDTAREFGIDRQIRYRHRVHRVGWSSAQARWTVEIDRGESALTMTCAFLFMCSGYYRYDTGYAPTFPGMRRFAGRIVHPQHWTDDIAWEGRRVVVIGSGATAMTLVPAMAERAAKVTLLQRSPTWVVARPSEDPLARALRGVLPARLAHAIVRWKQVLLGIYVFRLCRRRPGRMRDLLLSRVGAALGPAADVKTHFTPRYNPWEQRLCLLPDGDLFSAIRAGRVKMVTDHIVTLTEKGIALESGTEVEADLIVSATGLELQAIGGIELTVDGERIEAAKTFQYKGMMFSGVPNFASIFGYTNASWTLKSDLAAEYVCRLLNFMRKRGYRVCTPQPADPAMPTQPWVDFSSGYLQRALERFPKQGTRAPWKLNQNYLADIALLRFGRIDDGALRFAGAPVA
jgi:monooxygenase